MDITSNGKPKLALLHHSRKEQSAIFNDVYRKQAKVELGVEKCWACNFIIGDNEPIWVSLNRHKTKRRHMHCAINKGIVEQEEVMDWLEGIVDDMEITIPNALKKFLI